MSLDARDRSALPRRPRRQRARPGREGRGAPAPARARRAGHGPRDAAPPELPRAAALIDHAQGDGARRHLVSRGRRVVVGVRPRGRSGGRRPCARTRRDRGVRGRSSSGRSSSTRDDFESGFVAESPAKLRRLPQYYDGARRRRAASAASPATRRRCRWWSRRTASSGRASFTSRSATFARRRSASIVANAACPRSAQTLDVGTQPGVRAVRLLDEDRVEERAVAVTDRPGDTRRAFDSVAADYDRSNVENPCSCARCGGERSRRCCAHVPRGVARARSRLRSGHRRGSARCARLHGDRHRLVAGDGRGGPPPGAAGRPARIASTSITSASTQLDVLPPASFDAAYSNFGPLNCVADLERAARLIARRLRRGGMLVASVIGRVCPWEIALYASRGDLARARVRFARGSVPVPLNGRIVSDALLHAGGVRASCSRRAGFRRVSLRALGLFVPPPYMEAFAGRHPALVARAAGASTTASAPGRGCAACRRSLSRSC